MMQKDIRKSCDCTRSSRVPKQSSGVKSVPSSETHLSIAIAIRVRTDAETERMAMKFENLQYNSPNGQSLLSMYTKLTLTFRVETIVSANLKPRDGHTKDSNGYSPGTIVWTSSTRQQ
jgi:hypothetical protein